MKKLALSILLLSLLTAATFAVKPIDTSAPAKLLVNAEKPVRKAGDERPNFVIIFTDDQGYADLGCFGATKFKTPRIDSLAKEGTKFTTFYAQTVCGCSRSALLTGRQPSRSGGWNMPSSEVTLAEMLSKVGYATACIGKWDVSNRKAIVNRMPLAQGFDYYWGALGANDGGRITLHRNNKLLGTTKDMASLTRWYTNQAIAFIEANKEKPFFLYLPHTMLHSVIGASPQFRGKSEGCLWGDTMEELDFETGRLLDTLDELGLRKNTLVVFTSDNGPWSNYTTALQKRQPGVISWGDAGPLRAAKASTYEGGIRVPCLIRYPGKIPAGRTSDAIFATIDFVPTFLNLAGCKELLPKDRIIDGVDQTELLLGKSEKGNRNIFYYFDVDSKQCELQCVRDGKWKLRLPNLQFHRRWMQNKAVGLGSQKIELYDLEADLGETKNVAKDNPEVVARLLKLTKDYKYEDKDVFSKAGKPKVQPKENQ